MRNVNLYNLRLNKDQVIGLINQLDFDDKIELLNDLKESTYLKRFKKLLSSLRTDELSLDEITKEVEIVRKKRYASGIQKI